MLLAEAARQELTVEHRVNIVDIKVTHGLHVAIHTLSVVGKQTLGSSSELTWLGLELHLVLGVYLGG